MKKKFGSLWTVLAIMLLGMVLSACSQNKGSTVSSSQKDESVTTPQTTALPRDQKDESVTTPQATELPRDEDASLFVVEKGTLVKYKGNFDREREIVLPSDVKVIGKKAFSLGKNDRKKPVGLLETLHLSIPAQVKLEREAFAEMGPMKIVFEEGRRIIEEEAFWGSVRAGISSEVVLPDTITTLKKRCFCNSLGGSFLTVKLGNGVEIIEDYALYGGIYVDSIPASVKKIGKEALGDWGRLPNDLPEGVETLASYFLGLAYGKVYIPASVKKIGIEAVYWTEDDAIDQGYVVAEDNPYYKSDDNGCLYSKDGKTLYYAYLPATHYKIPDGVKTVYEKGLHLGPDDEKDTVIEGLDRVKVVK